MAIAHYNIHIHTYDIRNEETKGATKNLLTKTLF